MKHLGKTLVCLVLIISVCISTANAFEIMPLADSEFDVASALLSTRKDVFLEMLKNHGIGSISRIRALIILFFREISGNRR